MTGHDRREDTRAVNIERNFNHLDFGKKVPRGRRFARNWGRCGSGYRRTA